MNVIIFEPDHLGDLRREDILQRNKQMFLEAIKKYEDYLCKDSIVITPELFLGRIVENVIEEVFSIFYRNFIIIAGGVKVINNKLYNVAIISNGVKRHIHRKYHLWANEEKIFSRGSETTLVEIGRIRIAPFICSDIVDPRYKEKYGVMYNKKNLDSLKSECSGVIIAVLSASYYKGLDIWEMCLKEISRIYFPVIYCNWRNVFKYGGEEYGGDRSGVFINGKMTNPIEVEEGDLYTVKMFQLES